VRNVSLIGILVVATAAVFTTGFTRISGKHEQIGNARLNVKDLAEHGLVIVASSDPSYDAMIQELLKDRSDPIVDSLGPFSVFIKNASRGTVVACMLNWEMLQSNGRIRRLRTEYTNLPALMGNDVNQIKEGLKIRPNSAWFFSPAYLQVNQDEVGSKRPSSVDNALLISDLDKTRRQLARDLSITVTLDGAFFEDGTFVGPDETGFFAKVEAIRNAKKDLFQEIENDRRKGKAQSEVFRYVEELATRSEIKLSDTSTPADYYNSFKQDAAAQLIRIKKRDGDDKALDHAYKRAQTAWPELRKLSIAKAK
jgi:hypothetical protein